VNAPASELQPSERRPLLIAGGGEHACVVVDAALAGAIWRVAGYTDLRDGALIEQRFGIEYVGDDATGGPDPSSDEMSYIVGVGYGTARLRAVAALEARGVSFGTVVHPRAIVAPSATLSAGAVVLAGSIVNTGAFIGQHAIVNTGAIVEHDVRVERLAHVAPGATIGGGATIGAGATIGLGARVRDHVTIGEGAFVGMGAVVVADVPPGARVVGIPARAMR
jgi:acetyltransferase EpsM